MNDPALGKPLDTRPPEITGIRDNAYKELISRGVPKDLIIRAMGGENPTYLGEMLKRAPEQIGGAVGAVAGGVLLKNPMGVTSGSTIGAGVGGMAGKAIGLATGAEQVPEGGAMSAIGQAGVEQAGYNLAGVGISKLAAAGKGITNLMPVEGAANITKTAKRFNIPIDASDISQKPVFSMIEEAARKSPFSAQSMVARDIQAVKGSQAMVDDIRTTFNATANDMKGIDLFKLWDDARKEKKAIWTQIENKKWDDHRDTILPEIAKRQEEITVTRNVPSKMLGPDGKPVMTQVSHKEIRTDPSAMVDMRPVAGKANEVLEVLKEVNKNKEGLPPSDIGHTLEAAGLLKDIVDKPDFIEWETVHKLRSLLLRTERQMGINKELAASNVRRLNSEITDQMGITASNMGDESYNSWVKARAITNAKHEKLDNELFDTLNNKVAKNPDAVRQLLLANDTPVKLREIRKIMGEKRWADVQSSAIDDFFTKSSDVAPEFTEPVLNGKKMMDRMKREGGSLSVLLSPEARQAMTDAGRTLMAIQAKGAPLLGMGVATTQHSAVSSLMSGAIHDTALIALAAPATFSKAVLTNPRLVSVIAKQSESKLGSPESISRVGKFVSSVLPKEMSDKVMEAYSKLPAGSMPSGTLRLMNLVNESVKGQKDKEAQIEAAFNNIAPTEIKSPAIKTKLGDVIKGENHARIRASSPDAKGGKTGFVTTDGQFVDRKQGANIVGQTKPLHSSDLK